MRKLLLPLVALGVLYFSLSSIFNQYSQLVKPELFKVDKVFSSLEKAVSNALAGTQGTYAVVIENMSTGKGYALNGDKVFESASLYKLWVMGTVFDKIQKGEIKGDDVLSQRIEVLNREFEIDDELAELKSGGITLSVDSALNQMITISHNYASLLLMEKVRNSQIKEFIRQNGFNASDLGTPPETTASDTGLFFKKLYRKELVNWEYSEKMIELLKNQKLNDGIPKKLPEGTVVAHKTGELGWFKHDAGIVFAPSGDYIIVILSESESPNGAQERIAEVSEAIYKYFTSN